MTYTREHHRELTVKWVADRGRTEGWDAKRQVEEVEFRMGYAERLGIIEPAPAQCELRFG